MIKHVNLIVYIFCGLLFYPLFAVSNKANCDSIFQSAQELIRHGYNDSAQVTLDIALNCYNYNNNISKCGETLNQKAIVYRNCGDYTNALHYFQLAIDKHLSINNEEGVAQTYNSLGILYMDWRDYDQALYYYNKSKNIYTSINIDIKLADVLNNIGLVYKYQQDYITAIEYFYQSLEIREKSGDKSKIAVSFHNIGTVYNAQQNYQKAIDYYLKAYDIRKGLDNKKDIAVSLNAIGNAYMNLGNYQLADIYYKDGLNIAKEIQCVQMIITLYENMTINYSALGKNLKFREYFDLYIGYYDSIYNLDKHRQIAELQTIYETEKKQQEIINLNNELAIKNLESRNNRIILGFLSFIIVFVIVFAIFWHRNTKLKSELRIKNLNQRLLQLQMNPHFIFNSLNAIEEYILKEEPIKASSYLANFAKLMRSILDFSRINFITINEELEILEYYLKLQQLRFENSFNYYIECDNEIDTDSMCIPPMLLQPFVENSIEHGLRKKQTDGIIDIKLIKETDNIKIIITDNGIGIKHTTKNNVNNHKSKAITITNERLNLLFKHEKTISTIDLSEPINGGTQVIIAIPIFNSTKM